MKCGTLQSAFAALVVFAALAIFAGLVVALVVFVEGLRCSAVALNDKLARLLGGPEHEKRQEALRVGKKEVTVGEVQGVPATQTSPHKSPAGAPCRPRRSSSVGVVSPSGQTMNACPDLQYRASGTKAGGRTVGRTIPGFGRGGLRRVLLGRGHSWRERVSAGGSGPPSPIPRNAPW